MPILSQTSCSMRLAIDQLHGQGLDVAVAADLEADLAARRNLAEHAAQLLGAVDVLAVDGDHNIIDLEPDLAGGCVVIDESDDSAAHFFQLERLRFVGIDIGNIDAEIAGRAGVDSRGTGILKDRRQFPRLGVRPVGGRQAARSQRQRQARRPTQQMVMRTLRYGLKRCFIAIFSPCCLSSGLRSSRRRGSRKG